MRPPASPHPRRPRAAADLPASAKHLVWRERPGPVSEATVSPQSLRVHSCAARAARAASRGRQWSSEQSRGLVTARGGAGCTRANRPGWAVASERRRGSSSPPATRPPAVLAAPALVKNPLGSSITCNAGKCNAGCGLQRKLAPHCTECYLCCNNLVPHGSRAGAQPARLSNVDGLSAGPSVVVGPGALLTGGTSGTTTAASTRSSNACPRGTLSCGIVSDGL